MELLFYYLSAVTGLSVTSETMNGKFILININNYTKTVCTGHALMDHFALTAKKQIKLIPKQIQHMEEIFATLPNQTWPEDFGRYIQKLQEEEPSQKWCKADNLALAIPQARQNA
jgi:F0F1-type ATP synthase membrane subunit a